MMSDVKKEKDALSESVRRTLSLKTPATAIAAELGADADEKDTEEKSNGQVRKPTKEPAKVKSVSEIFTDAFSVQKSKDGNIKPARIIKADLKVLSAAEKVERFGVELVDTLCKNAEVTDPGLDCLTEIVLNVLESKNSESQKYLFYTCIQMASRVWIKKHRGSLDLYEDIFEGLHSQEDMIQHLETSLSGMFAKRAAHLVKTETENPSGIGGAKPTTSENLEESAKSGNLTKQMLEKQQRNLLVVGLLWLLEKGKVNPEAVLNHFFSLIDTEPTSKATLRDVSLYLANQRLAPEARFIRVVSMLRYQIRTLSEDKTRFEKLLKQREQQISQLLEEHSSLNRLAESARQEVSGYQICIDGLKKQIENQQLDERATRTHLRDSEGKVRAKAFNLLSEEVLEPLRLSLAALLRENPKTEVAIHQIELVVESIERDLKWFKE